MMVVITYDVNTESESGQKRLRKVAKLCEKYGIRVQNSVFECIMSPSQCLLLKNELSEVMDLGRDSLRLYYLGNNYKTKIEHIGAKKTIKVDETLIF